ncbi:LysR family transcriptional regulator, partial [Rhodococcus hoagii]|nr:LysR family transcriptional regulator [Prescottella equi]
MNVELRHLRALFACDRRRDLHRAAERLSITQPALTRTIQQLEATLGTRCWRRTSRSRSPPTTASLRERVRHVLRDLMLPSHRCRQPDVRLGFSWLLP